MLTLSFPYVRDWLNEHPFKNESDARLICNLRNGSPISPKTLWNLMEQLKRRIIRLIENGEITDEEERQKLDYLLKTKKWNPYCIRHSAITADSDYLPEYALKKKVRWSMNSKQGTRYIKTRMGTDLKNKILEQNGITTQDYKNPQSLNHNCPRCTFVNVHENKYCSKCSYPLNPSAYEEIKKSEEDKLTTMERKNTQDLKDMKSELISELETKFQYLLSRIDLGKL